ncbi:unnamed protein product [Cyprideis torosa]|uniref:Uncharacterized protein n=1 Tax=Cyprideis torosa TaxID=163714 RepID=A0A7R8ZN46_9CRUS|nr:unnamed protein product [Cyprideis torosa]CAG0890627.1 unnamed protein product [Cyprideis torosa]
MIESRMNLICLEKLVNWKAKIFRFLGFILQSDSTNDTMKALVFDADSLKLSIQEVEEPKVESPTQVLVAPKFVGVCGTDVHIVHPGDRVGVDPNLSACGRVCGPCSKAQYNFCTKMDVGYAYGIHMNGGFAEKVVVEGAQVYPFPPDLKPENSFLCETLSCVNYGRGKLGILDQDANILILGAGVVGLMWGCLLHHEGKRNLIISEPSEIRRNTAEKLDVFKDVFTPEELAKTYQGQKFVFDVVIDACGVAVAVEKSVSLMRKGGTLVIFACAPPSQNVSLNLFQVYERELKVQGVLTNPYSYGKTVPLVLAMQERYMNIERLAVDRFPLEKYEDAFAALRKGAIAKGVIVLP